MIALDLYSCAGGSATGLERAGFDVIGVDHKPSHHWTGSGPLHRADLSTADDIVAVIEAFAPDFVSSSPPCQAFSAATPIRSRAEHPNLIPAMREALVRTRVPGWIENVNGAPLHHSIRLCGSMFPATQQLRRHRYFELHGWFTFEPEHAHCTFLPTGGRRDALQVTGHGAPGRLYRAEKQRRDVVSVKDGTMGTNSRKARQRREVICVVPGATSVRGSGNGQDRAKRDAFKRRVVTMAGKGGHGPGQAYGQNNAGHEAINWRRAMGWLDGPRHRYSRAQAIPPAYAEWLGRRFLERTIPTEPAP